MPVTDDERLASIRQTLDELNATSRVINRELREPMWRQTAKVVLTVLCIAAFLAALSVGMKVVLNYLAH